MIGSMNRRSPSSTVGFWAICLIVIAALTPALVALATALLPLVIVLTIAAILLRLVFFHTRRY